MQVSFRMNPFVLFVILFFAGASSSTSGVRVKPPKVDVQIGAGYDSNIFRVSQASDSNRVEAPRQTIDGGLSWWIYWDKRIRTYLSASGQYSNYQQNTFANEWDWKARGKTFLTLNRRPRGFKPGIKWMFEFEAAQRDQIYTDRALGAENFLTLNGNGGDVVPLKDLLDRSSFLLGSGFDIDFTRWSSLSLEYFMQTNDYKNIDSPTLQSTYSLDNSESGFLVDFVIEPTRMTKIRLSYQGVERQYEHKLARNMDRVEIPDVPRQYRYDKYGVTFYWDTNFFQARIFASSRIRKDLYEGYYNYNYQQVGGRVAFDLPFNMILSLGLKSERKDYENLTLSGQVLQNRYETFDLGLAYPIWTNIDFRIIFIRDLERSTYEKFTYDRNIFLGGFVFGRGR